MSSNEGDNNGSLVSQNAERPTDAEETQKLQNNGNKDLYVGDNSVPMNHQVKASIDVRP